MEKIGETVKRLFEVTMYAQDPAGIEHVRQYNIVTIDRGDDRAARDLARAQIGSAWRVKHCDVRFVCDVDFIDASQALRSDLSRYFERVKSSTDSV